MTDSLEAVKNAGSSTTTPGTTASSSFDMQPTVIPDTSKMTGVVNDLRNSVLQVKSHATREMNGPNSGVSSSNNKSSSVIVSHPDREGSRIEDFLSEFGHLADIFTQEQDLLSGNSKDVPPHPDLKPADLLAFFTVLAAAVEHNKMQKHSLAFKDNINTKSAGNRLASADQQCVGVGNPKDLEDKKQQHKQVPQLTKLQNTSSSTQQKTNRNPATVQTAPRQNAEKFSKASEDSPSSKQLPRTIEGLGTERNNVPTAVEPKELRLGDMVSQLRDMSTESPMESVPTGRSVNTSIPASHATAPYSDIASSDATPPSNEPPDPDTRSKNAREGLPSNNDGPTTVGTPGVQSQPETSTPPQTIPIESEPKPNPPAGGAQAREIPGTEKRTLPTKPATGSPARPVQGSAGPKTVSAMRPKASAPVKPQPAVARTPGRVAPTNRISGTAPASQRVVTGTASAEQRPEARSISPPMNEATSQQKVLEPVTRPEPSNTESEPEPEGPSGQQPVLVGAAYRSLQSAPSNTNASITPTDQVVDMRTTEPQVETLKASKENHEQQTPSQVPEQVAHVTEPLAQSANAVPPQMDNEPLPDSQAVAAEEVPHTQAAAIGITESGQVTAAERLPDQAEGSVQRPQNSQTGASGPENAGTDQPASQEQTQQTTTSPEAIDTQTSTPPGPPIEENGTASVESSSGAPGVVSSQQEQAGTRTAGPVDGTRAAPTTTVRARPVAKIGPGARPAQSSATQPGMRPPAGAVAARQRAAAGSSPAGNAVAANGVRPQVSQAAPPPGQAKATLAPRPRPAATATPGTSAVPRTAPTARVGAGPATTPGSAARVAVKRPPQAGAPGAAAPPRPQAAVSSATGQGQPEARINAPSTMEGQNAPPTSTGEPEAAKEPPGDGATGTTPEAEEEQPGDSATGTTPEAVKEQPDDSATGTTPESKPVATKVPPATRPAGTVPSNGADKAPGGTGLDANAPNGAPKRPGSTTGAPAQNPVTSAAAGPRPPVTASAAGQVRPRPTGQPSAPANGQGRLQAAQQGAQANGKPTRPPGAQQQAQTNGQPRQIPPRQQSAPATGGPTRPPAAQQQAQANGQPRQVPPGQRSAPANGQARPVPAGQQSTPVPGQARQMPVAQQQASRPMPQPLQQPQAVADAPTVAPERRPTHELKSIERAFEPPSRFSFGLRSHSHGPREKPLPPLPPSEDEDYKPSRRTSWWRRHFGSRRDEEWELRPAPQPQFRQAAPQLRAMSANQPQFRVAPAQAAMQPMSAQNGYGGGGLQQQPRPMGSVMGGAGMGIVPPQQAAPVYAPEPEEYDPYGYDNGLYDNDGYDNGGYDGAPAVAAPARTPAAGTGTVTGGAGMGLVGGPVLMDDAGGWDGNGDGYDDGYGDRFVDDGFEEPQPQQPQQRQQQQQQQYQDDGAVQYYN